MSNKMYMQEGKLVVPDHVVIPFFEGGFLYTVLFFFYFLRRFLRCVRA